MSRRPTAGPAPNANVIVSRQETDQECRQTHYHQGQNQEGLAANTIAEMTEYETTERSDQEPAANVP
jgi:hypothetical protein